MTALASDLSRSSPPSNTLLLLLVLKLLFRNTHPIQLDLPLAHHIPQLNIMHTAGFARLLGVTIRKHGQYIQHLLLLSRDPVLQEGVFTKSIELVGPILGKSYLLGGFFAQLCGLLHYRLQVGVHHQLRTPLPTVRTSPLPGLIVLHTLQEVQQVKTVQMVAEFASGWLPELGKSQLTLQIRPNPAYRQIPLTQKLRSQKFKTFLLTQGIPLYNLVCEVCSTHPLHKEYTKQVFSVQASLGVFAIKNILIVDSNAVIPQFYGVLEVLLLILPLFKTTILMKGLELLSDRTVKTEMAGIRPGLLLVALPVQFEAANLHSQVLAVVDLRVVLEGHDKLVDFLVDQDGGLDEHLKGLIEGVITKNDASRADEGFLAVPLPLEALHVEAIRAASRRALDQHFLEAQVVVPAETPGDALQADRAGGGDLDFFGFVHVFDGVVSEGLDLLVDEALYELVDGQPEFLGVRGDVLGVDQSADALHYLCEETVLAETSRILDQETFGY